MINRALAMEPTERRRRMMRIGAWGQGGSLGRLQFEDRDGDDECECAI
jgi:hypothetical protein